MSHSSIPNSPNLPPPPNPSPPDPSRNRDEWIAVLVALLAMGGIFFWVLGDTDRPGGLRFSRSSSSTQVGEDPLQLSKALKDPSLLDSFVPSNGSEESIASATSNSSRFSSNSSAATRRAWQAWRWRMLFGNTPSTQTAPQTPSAEEATEVPVEAETPLDSEATETPAAETEEGVTEGTTEGTTEETTEEPAVAPTEESQTPETEAETSETEAETPGDTDEPADTTTDQSRKPRFGIPILGLGGKTDEKKTPAATSEDPTAATVATPETEADAEAEETPAASEAETSEDPTVATTASPEAEAEETPAASEAETSEDPTVATTASPEAEAEETPTAAQPETSEDPTVATTASPEAETEQAEETASPGSEEQATAKKPDKPSFGIIPIPGFGSKSSDTETPAAASAEFSDVPDDFWAKDYIQYFAQQDIITGYEDGTFKPEETMSRAAVAAQIEDSLGFVEAERKKPLNFEDVGQSFWAETAIDSTTKTGFLSGYPGDVFRPEKPMSRTEALVALVSGLDVKPSGDPEEILKIYQDADQIPAWAVEKVAAATEAGLVVSYPNTNTLNPNAPVTRAEISAMIYQALVQAGKVDQMPSEYIVNPKQ